VLHAVTRERRTINYTAQFGGKHSEQPAQKMKKLQHMKLCPGSYAMEDGTMQHNRKVIIGVIVHDLMAKRRLRRTRWQNLRQKSLKIFHQNNIYYKKLRGVVRFEFKTPYKLHVSVQQGTLCFLRIASEVCCLSPMNQSYWEDLVTSPVFAKLSELNQKFILDKMPQSCRNCEYWRCCL